MHPVVKDSNGKVLMSEESVEKTEGVHEENKKGGWIRITKEELRRVIRKVCAHAKSQIYSLYQWTIQVKNLSV